MRFVNISAKKITVFVLLVLSLLLFNYQSVNAEKRIDEKSYKVSKEAIPWFPEGLEVDLEGNIYIGSSGRVNVYDAKGNFKYAIKVETYGAFQMKIDNNDMLNVVLAREGEVLVYDNEGYIIQKKVDENNTIYDEYEKNNRRKKDSLGNEYRLSNFLGNTKVVRINQDNTKTLIYQIPFLVCFFKVFIPMIVLIFIALVVILVIKSHSFSK